MMLIVAVTFSDIKKIDRVGKYTMRTVKEVKVKDYILDGKKNIYSVYA